MVLQRWSVAVVLSMLVATTLAFSTTTTNTNIINSKSETEHPTPHTHEPTREPTKPPSPTHSPTAEHVPTHSPTPASKPPTKAPTRSCGLSFGAGQHTLNLSTGRKFVLIVPPSLSARKVPVVFNFHGYAVSWKEQQQLSGLDQYVLNERWLVVYPIGTDVYDPNYGRVVEGFNAGGCCGPNPWQIPVIDDVQYTRDIIAMLDDKMCVDTHSLFATGFDNGAFMAYRIACQLHENFLAVAPHSGLLAYGGDFTECEAGGRQGGRAVQILHFHGKLDTTVPFGGDPSEQWPSYYQLFDMWKRFNKCTGTPYTSLRSDTTWCQKYTSANCTPVEFCEIDKIGHTWSGGRDDTVKTDVRASEYMIKSFRTIFLAQPPATSRIIRPLPSPKERL